MLLTAAAALIALATSSSQTRSQPADANLVVKAAEAACPPDSIALSPGMSIQTAVEKARPGASFCIKAGIHRLQFVAPKAGQKFFGEPGSVLNGARVLTRFERDGNSWVAPGQTQIGTKHEACAKDLPTCALSAGFFIDDKPLQQVASKAELAPNRFFFDRAAGRIHFVDDPTGKRVEVTAARFAFKSPADNVLIKGLVIEKYYNSAQEGAVQGKEAKGWRVERTEFRLNSGVGVAVGTNGAIVDCRIHHNGQLGVSAAGTDILLEGNEIWANNIYGFDFDWEAGGVKITNSDRVTMRDNHVHHNVGPGLWCDINCRDVIYEGNTVEYNAHAGILHEISYAAVIRNNTLRENGQAALLWFWGSEIQVAASQDVEVHGNAMTVRPDGRAIMLIDQNRQRVLIDHNRQRDTAGYYKTQRNYVHHNDITYLGAGWTGGASDVQPGAQNFSIIENGGNRFDHNTYRVPDGVHPQFVWGHSLLDLTGFRVKGQERNSILLPQAKSSE